MDNQVILQRNSSNTQYGTFGTLLNDTKHICYTLELPWRFNQNNISCIPAGIYKVIPTKEGKFTYLHYIVQDVPNRENVEMHRGNTILDTEGCILVGTDYSDQGIWNSREALELLTTQYPRGFTIIIKDIPNVS